MPKPQTVDTFWRKVVKLKGGCWEWAGGRDSDGYGIVSWHNKSIKAHRFLAEMVLGWKITGLCVCHHCDNPACVRPDHLFLGTHADNAHDRDRKGRGIRGRKFTEEHKARISASNKGRVITQEMRSKISATLTGHIRTAESRSKQSAATKGIKKPEVSEWSRGEKNGNAKLTWREVTKMRKLYAAGGVTKVLLSQMFHIGIGQVYGIISGRSWVKP